MNIDMNFYNLLAKKVTKADNTIPDIYIYCDQWCDRCGFTARCSVFKNGQEPDIFDQDPDLIDEESDIFDEEPEIQDEQYLHSLRANCDEMVESLSEKMERLELIAEEVDNQVEEECDFIDNLFRSDMVLVSNCYGFYAARWIYLNPDLILMRYDLQRSINQANADLIDESFEVIENYLKLIVSKIFRASLVSDHDDTVVARGLVKVSLIAIDRSIAAWSAILPYFASSEDDILRFLKLLAKTKRMILKSFPTAMDFVRPGFDE